MATEQTQSPKQNGVQSLNQVENALQVYMLKAGADFANTMQNLNTYAPQKSAYTPPAQKSEESSAVQAPNEKNLTNSKQMIANSDSATMSDFIKRMQELNRQYS